MSTSPLAEEVVGCLREVGISDWELVSASPESPSFGDSEAVFRVERLLVHFTRDRGQDFMDVAFAPRTDEFFQFGDVIAAMGWKKMEAEKWSPPPLKTLIGRLHLHLAELGEAVSAVHEVGTREKIRAAEFERGEAFIRRLRGEK